jgi:adenylosuccinate synthase
MEVYMFADVVVDLQYGDCGKGKVTHALCRQEDYTHVVRYNGGCNAGHTIFHNGRKFITHHIPAGVFFGIKSIIGSGCVLNVEQFFKEIKELKDGGIDTDGLIFVAENTHIITKYHLEEDSRDTKIGTTKRGNGPAYRDKYDRTGFRAKDIPELESYTIDLYDELHVKTPNAKILFEGAQGFGLDVDWGDYPYVTSSNCISAAACMNGVPPQNIRNVWGVAKGYETYVGAKKFQPEGEVYNLIQEVGEEYGATTGRKRQVNWMDLNFLKKAININGVTHLVINKMDVLEKINSWALYKDNKKINFESSHEFKNLLWENTKSNSLQQIHFSGHKDKI